MQHRAVFGAVDVFAPRLGLGLLQHARFLRQVQQRGQHLRRGLLAAGVQPQAGHLELQAGVARVVAAREQFAQVGQGLGRQPLQAVRMHTRAAPEAFDIWITIAAGGGDPACILFAQALNLAEAEPHGTGGADDGGLARRRSVRRTTAAVGARGRRERPRGSLVMLATASSAISARKNTCTWLMCGTSISV